MATSNNLPPIFRFDFGDYTDLGTVFQKFLANLNLFTLAVYNLLNKGLGYQNLQQAIYTFEVTADTETPMSFANPISINPSAVVLGQVILVDAPNTVIANALSVANWNYDGKFINIQNIAGLTSGTEYQVTVIVS